MTEEGTAQERVCKTGVKDSEAVDSFLSRCEAPKKSRMEILLEKYPVGKDGRLKKNIPKKAAVVKQTKLPEPRFDRLAD